MKADSPYFFVMTLRPLLLPLVVALIGCTDPVEDSLPGSLVRVTVIGVSDSTLPPREVGDGGTQFFGVRADGGVAFTISQQLQFGPLVDGGSLISVQRVSVPTPNAGRFTISDEGCTAISNWTVVDGGLQLSQSFPERVDCPTAPEWLPELGGEAVRRYELTPISSCDLKCVRLSEASEVSCDC